MVPSELQLCLGNMGQLLSARTFKNLAVPATVARAISTKVVAFFEGTPFAEILKTILERPITKLLSRLLNDPMSSPTPTGNYSPTSSFVTMNTQQLTMASKAESRPDGQGGERDLRLALRTAANSRRASQYPL